MKHILIGDDIVSEDKVEKEFSNDKDVEKVANEILEKHKKAFEELSKDEDYIFNDKSLEEIYDEAKKHWEDKK